MHPTPRCCGAQLEEMGDACSDLCDPLLSVLNTAPSFKDANAMVCAAVYALTGTLAKKARSVPGQWSLSLLLCVLVSACLSFPLAHPCVPRSTFTKGHAAVVIPFIVAKLADKKIVGAAGEALVAYAESCGRCGGRGRSMRLATGRSCLGALDACVCPFAPTCAHTRRCPMQCLRKGEPPCLALACAQVRASS